MTVPSVDLTMSDGYPAIACFVTQDILSRSVTALKEESGVEIASAIQLQFELRFHFHADMSKFSCVRSATSVLISGLKDLYLVEQNADVTLICEDGVEIRAHSAVLMAMSPVFHVMFSGDFREKLSGVCKILDFDGTIIRHLVNYMYGINDRLTLHEVLEVLVAADKYDVAELRSDCIDCLLFNVNRSTADEIRRYAALVGVELLTDLFTGCFEHGFLNQNESQRGAECDSNVTSLYTHSLYNLVDVPTL